MSNDAFRTPHRDLDLARAYSNDKKGGPGRLEPVDGIERRRNMDETFDFGEAIRRMKTGACVARLGWNGKGMHIYLEDGYTMKIKGGIYKGTDRHYEPVIVMFTAQNKHQPGWLASQADMLADDWRVTSGN